MRGHYSRRRVSVSNAISTVRISYGANDIKYARKTAVLLVIKFLTATAFS